MTRKRMLYVGIVVGVGVLWLLWRRSTSTAPSATTITAPTMETRSGISHF
jgi:hypothetical protein